MRFPRRTSVGQGPDRDPAASMALLEEVLDPPVGPGYHSAAEARREAGLPASSGFSTTLMFVTALVLAPWLVRHLSREQRWHMIDGAAIGLAVGMMGGRIGCYAVGEHLGGPTSFPLGITYLGGQTVEAQPDGPLVVGTGFSSHGFIHAPVAGETLASLADSGVPAPVRG